MELGLEERGRGDVLAGDGERLLRRLDPGDERAELDQLGCHLAGRRRHVHHVLAVDVAEALPRRVGKPGGAVPGGKRCSQAARFMSVGHISA